MRTIIMFSTLNFYLHNNVINDGVTIDIFFILSICLEKSPLNTLGKLKCQYPRRWC